MKTLSVPHHLVAVLALTSLLGVSGGAVAQGMGHMPGSMHQPNIGESAPGDRSERHARYEQRMQKWHTERLNRLKAALKLSPEQESAWNTFVSRTLPPSRPQMPAAEDVAKLTTPQRLDRMLAMKTERDAHMVAKIEATKSFYASLRPEQQKVFDDQTHRTHLKGWGLKGEHHMHHPG